MRRKKATLVESFPAGVFTRQLAKEMARVGRFDYERHVGDDFETRGECRVEDRPVYIFGAIHVHEPVEVEHAEHRRRIYETWTDVNGQRMGRWTWEPWH